MDVLREGNAFVGLFSSILCILFVEHIQNFPRNITLLLLINHRANNKDLLKKETFSSEDNPLKSQMLITWKLKIQEEKFEPFCSELMEILRTTI